MAAEASRVRFNEMGLVPILAGKRVVAMDGTRAIIECKATPGYAPARQTFIRHGARRAIETELAAKAIVSRLAVAESEQRQPMQVVLPPAVDAEPTQHGINRGRRAIVSSPLATIRPLEQRSATD
jgi:hypothetical protein